MRAGDLVRQQQSLLAAGHRLRRVPAVAQDQGQIDHHARRLALTQWVRRRQRQGKGLFQVQSRRPEVTQMHTGLAKLGVGVKELTRAAAAVRVLHQLLGQVLRMRQIGADERDVPKAPQGPNQLAWLATGAAQQQCALVGRCDIARGIAARDHLGATQ